MTTAVSDLSPSGLFGTPKRRQPPPETACWCCGQLGRHRGDAACWGRPLCADCWAAKPAAYDEVTRSASTLRLALGLPDRQSAVVQSRVRELAVKLGVVAFCDAETAGPNERRFGHIHPLVLAQARHELDQAGGAR